MGFAVAYCTACPEVIKNSPYFVDFLVEMISVGKQYELFRDRVEIENILIYEKIKTFRIFVTFKITIPQNTAKHQYNLKSNTLTCSVFSNGFSLEKEYILSNAFKSYTGKLWNIYAGPNKVRKKRIITLSLFLADFDFFTYYDLYIKRIYFHISMKKSCYVIFFVYTYVN